MRRLPQKSKGRTWVWIILGIVLVFVFYLAFRHHDETQAADKKGGGKKGFGGPVTFNTVTAKQGRHRRLSDGDRNGDTGLHERDHQPGERDH